MVSATARLLVLLVLTTSWGCTNAVGDAGNTAIEPIANAYAFGSAYSPVMATCLRHLGEPPLEHVRPAYRVMYVPVMTRHMFVVRISLNPRGDGAILDVSESEECLGGPEHPRFRREQRTLRDTSALVRQLRSCLDEASFWDLRLPEEDPVADGELWTFEAAEADRYAMFRNVEHPSVPSNLKRCFVLALRSGFPNGSSSADLRFQLPNVQ